MDIRKIIAENIIVKHFKDHPWYWLLAASWGWVMSDFLTSPVFTSIAIILIVSILIIISFGSYIKSKVNYLFKSEKSCNNTVDFSILIFCFLLISPFWNKLVYFCDGDNPCKQLLRTGTADVNVIINKENIKTLRRPSEWGDWGPLMVGKDGNFILFMELSLSSIRTKEVDPNQICFYGTLILDTRDKAINKPISDLSKADCVLLRFNNTLKESNVVGGNIIFNFNGGSVQYKVPIPSQQIKNETIIVEDIKNYFKK